MDKYTTEYKFIRIFIVYVWIHSYNFLFHKGKGTQRQTLFHFYAADLDFDLKGAFPKIQTVNSNIGKCCVPVLNIRLSGHDICCWHDEGSFLITATSSLLSNLKGNFTVIHCHPLLKVSSLFHLRADTQFVGCGQKRTLMHVQTLNVFVNRVLTQTS